MDDNWYKGSTKKYKYRHVSLWKINMESDCLLNLRRAYTESSRDFNEILRMNLIAKKRLYAELVALYSNMENNCAVDIIIVYCLSLDFFF